MNDKGKKHYLVGLGEILWDLLPGGKQLGGAPANFAYHAKALGANAAVVSCVGEDEAGREILALLQPQGLDLAAIAVDPAHPTGTVTVALNGQGMPQYIIHENVAWDHIPWSSGLAALAQRADAVCYGTLAQRSPESKETLRRFIQSTRQDCIRVFDINLRQAYYSGEVIEETLALSDVLKLNDEELSVVAELFSMQKTEDQLMKYLLEKFSLRLIALTRGAMGSTLATPDRIVDSESFPPQRLEDTVGAGDSYTAALTLGMLKGWSLEHIARHAARLAGYVCSCKGAMPPIPEDFRVE